MVLVGKYIDKDSNYDLAKGVFTLRKTNKNDGFTEQQSKLIDVIGASLQDVTLDPRLVCLAIEEYRRENAEKDEKIEPTDCAEEASTEEENLFNFLQ